MGHQDPVGRFVEDDLARIERALACMGGVVESSLDGAITALARADAPLAAQTAGADIDVDEAEIRINADCVRLLTHHQPLGAALRSILGAYRTSAILHRMGNQAFSVARRAPLITGRKSLHLAGVVRLGRMVQATVKDVLDAYADRDLHRAAGVRERDDDVDGLQHALIRETVALMTDDATTIPAATQLLFVLKSLERIGDHATDIAGIIHFMVTGYPVPSARQSASRRPLGAGQ
jgi:phosphate transport system protein